MRQPSERNGSFEVLHATLPAHIGSSNYRETSRNRCVCECVGGTWVGLWLWGGSVCAGSVCADVSVEGSPHVHVCVCPRVCVYEVQGWVCVLGGLCPFPCVVGGFVSVFLCMEYVRDLPMCLCVHIRMHEFSIWTLGSPGCLQVCTYMYLCVSGRVCICLL